MSNNPKDTASSLANRKAFFQNLQQNTSNKPSKPLSLNVSGTHSSQFREALKGLSESTHKNNIFSGGFLPNTAKAPTLDQPINSRDESTSNNETNFDDIGFNALKEKYNFQLEVLSNMGMTNQIALVDALEQTGGDISATIPIVINTITYHQPPRPNKNLSSRDINNDHYLVDEDYSLNESKNKPVPIRPTRPIPSTSHMNNNIRNTNHNDAQPPKVNVEKQVDIIIIFKNEKLREFYGEQIQQKQFQADISYAFKEYFNEKIVNKKMIHKNKIIEELYYNMKTSNINIIHNNFIEFIFKNIENEYCGVSSLTNFNVNVSNEFKNNGSTFKKYEHSAFSLVFNLVNFIYYFKTRKLPSLICESNILKHSFKKSKWDDYFDTIIEKQEQVFEILKKSFSSPEKGFKNCNLLFSGPSGSGKTHVAMNVFNSIIGAQKSFASVAAGLLTGIVSESFNKLNEWREEAESTPYILRYIIIDEAHMCLEQSTNSHSNTSSGDREIKSFLLEALSDIEKKHPNLVFVLCTNYRDILQKEVIRSGRISHEIYFPYVTQSIVSKVLKSEFNINDPHFEKLFTCCTISDIIKICDICQNQTQIKSTLTSIHTENQNYAMANLCGNSGRPLYLPELPRIFVHTTYSSSSIEQFIPTVLQKLDNAVLVKCYSQMNVPRDAEQRRLFFNSESFDIINMLSFGNVLIAFDLLSLEPYSVSISNGSSKSIIDDKDSRDYIFKSDNSNEQTISINKKECSIIKLIQELNSNAQYNPNIRGQLYTFLCCSLLPFNSDHLKEPLETMIYCELGNLIHHSCPVTKIFSSEFWKAFDSEPLKNRVFENCKINEQTISFFQTRNFDGCVFENCNIDIEKGMFLNCRFNNGYAIMGNAFGSDVKLIIDGSTFQHCYVRFTRAHCKNITINQKSQDIRKESNVTFHNCTCVSSTFNNMIVDNGFINNDFLNCVFSQCSCCDAMNFSNMINTNKNIDFKSLVDTTKYHQPTHDALANFAIQEIVGKYHSVLPDSSWKIWKKNQAFDKSDLFLSNRLTLVCVDINGDIFGAQFETIKISNTYLFKLISDNNTPRLYTYKKFWPASSCSGEKHQLIHKTCVTEPNCFLAIGAHDSPDFILTLNPTRTSITAHQYCVNILKTDTLFKGNSVELTDLYIFTSN